VSFRDDRDAQLERIAGLERELEVAQRAVAANQKASTELAGLRDRVAALSAERDQLRLGVQPIAARMRRTFFLFAIVMGVGSAAVLVYQQQELTAVSQQCERRAELLEREATVASEDAARAHLEAEQARAELRAPPAPPAPPTPLAPPAPAARETMLAGTVLVSVGQPGVRRGATCSVTLRYEARTSDCHASVTCNDVALYPQGGEGFFGCTLRDDRIVSVLDANPTEVSHDPRLDLDVDRRTLSLSDEHPSWSVTITLRDDSNPF
jgi:hypothetical protein